jgi:cytochrome c peroxidase
MTPRHAAVAALATVVCTTLLGLATTRVLRDDVPAPVVPARTPFDWRLPRGLPVPAVPPDNSMNAAKVALGRALFYDTRLSGNRTFACASCHKQELAFTDGRAHAIGSTGQEHPRSSMTLTNVAYNASFGWTDGNVRSLEGQLAVPMFNEHPVELGLKGREAEVVERFQGAADAERFAQAFPSNVYPVSFANIVKALAAFERTLVSSESPFDRLLYHDDRTALSASARRGMDLFFSTRIGCTKCHGGFNLSGPSVFEKSQAPVLTFHNTGLSESEQFRAPTLRNIALTAPYMHDGRIATLEAVVAHYASGTPATAIRSKLLHGFSVSRSEAADLVAFLESLTDRSFVTNPAFRQPN